jgi:hypothetical protein
LLLSLFSQQSALTRQRPFALQTWGKALAVSKGAKRARVAVAVARKLAALLHKLWLSGERFDWEAA